MYAFRFCFVLLLLSLSNFVLLLLHSYSLTHIHDRSLTHSHTLSLTHIKHDMPVSGKRFLAYRMLTSKTGIPETGISILLVSNGHSFVRPSQCRVNYRGKRGNCLRAPRTDGHQNVGKISKKYQKKSNFMVPKEVLEKNLARYRSH